MLFWIFVIMLVVGLGLIWNGFDSYNSISEEIGIFLTGTSAVIIVVMIFILCSCHLGVNGDVAENKERYNTLTYKIESGACRDEFGLLSKSVIDEVQEWNEDVIWYKEMHDDFWLGIFIPDEMAQFETIDYTKY